MSESEPEPDSPSPSPSDVEDAKNVENEGVKPDEKNSLAKLRWALLALIAVAAIVAFLVFGKGCGKDGSTEKATLTLEQLQRYKIGDYYRTIINTNMHGPIEGGDWGLVGSGTLLYQGELDIIREVQPKGDDDRGMNPDTDVKVALTIRKARDLVAAIEVEDIQLDVPPVVGNVLIYGAGAVANLQGGPVSATIVKIAASQLKKKWVRGGLVDALDFVTNAVGGREISEVFIPRPPSIGEFEGKKATYIYRAGQGLVDATSDGSLSAEQEKRLEDFSIFAEVHLFPAPGDKGSDKWEVDVSDIAHLLVPSSSVEASGKLHFARREREGSIVRIECINGIVDFSGKGEGAATLASWAARGSLYYDELKNTLVKGKLTGGILLEKRSEDHILFEAKWKVQPKYTVLISGYQTRDAEEAEKEIEPSELDL